MTDGWVDWGLARRLAGAVARGEPSDAWATPGARGRAAAICDEALQRVLAYTGMEPATPVPAAEVIARAEWIDSNVATMRELAAPLEARAAPQLALPGPLNTVARGAVGAAAGAEAGVVIGYASRRVLGQYQVALTASPDPPRMLLIGSNLTHAAAELGLESEGFLRWVAIHEQTHSVQFGSVPWLREHLAGLVAKLIDSASGGIDLAALTGAARRLVSRDPRKAIGEALRGELARALAGPEQAALLDDLQAAMAVVEGQAEHVMDAAAADDPDLELMRRRFDERRARRTGLADAIARALGMGMKLRQYELGKRFADAVTRAGGTAALNRVWEAPESLPTLAELEAPELWLSRMDTASSRSAA